MYRGNFPAASNRANWIESMRFIDPTNPSDETADFTDSAIVVEIRGPNVRESRLMASVANGKVIFTTPRSFQWSFTLAEMSGLVAGNYDVGIQMTRAGITTQLAIAKLPVQIGRAS